MKIIKSCMLCGETFTINVDDESYRRWSDGEMIEDALPELTTNEKNLLLNGHCNECMESLYESTNMES